MKIPKEIRWKPTGRTLGEGGQAQVQEVEDPSGEYPGRYALKALAKGKPRQAYDRFYREISAFKGLNHPYIVRVVDSSRPEDAFHYYVNELIEGAKPLINVLGTTANPFFCNPVAALDLFQKLAEALLACEQNEPRVIHRDLSPGNVLLLPDGTIRIIDFGVCQIEGEETITLIDEGVGTINYMAPECESGSTGSIGIHSDLYSAGKILWSAITGQRAFSREKPTYAQKSLSKVFPHDPATWHLHHIFAQTIRHDPKNRWRSAKDAIDACHLIRRLIQEKYPPIGEVFARCPVCGVGALKDFSGSHMVFGNPNPPGIYAKQCTYCGICMAINGDSLQKSIKETEALE